MAKKKVKDYGTAYRNAKLKRGSVNLKNGSKIELPKTTATQNKYEEGVSHKTAYPLFNLQNFTVIPNTSLLTKVFE